MDCMVFWWGLAFAYRCGMSIQMCMESGGQTAADKNRHVWILELRLVDKRDDLKKRWVCDVCVTTSILQQAHGST